MKDVTRTDSAGQRTAGLGWVGMTEAEWLDRISEHGCIVCLNMGLGYVPAEVHHLLRNGQRIDHKHAIPLCPPHHRGGMKDETMVSRHPWRREFEARYGTEWELLEQVRARVCP